MGAGAVLAAPLESLSFGPGPKFTAPLAGAWLEFHSLMTPRFRVKAP